MAQNDQTRKPSMPEKVQVIPLPDGWRIETFGKEKIAGGFVHLIDPQGEIHTRLTSADFEERPEKSALALLHMFEETLPNIGTEECPAFEVAEGLFLGGSTQDLWISEQHPTDRDTNFDDTQEIVYYDIEEWKTDAEDAIGAFLMCLIEEIIIENCGEEQE